MIAGNRWYKMMMVVATRMENFDDLAHFLGFLDILKGSLKLVLIEGFESTDFRV